MTFKEFKKMTAGVDEYQVFHQGTNKWYYGEEMEKWDNCPVQAFCFNIAGFDDKIVCTVDVVDLPKIN